MGGNLLRRPHHASTIEKALLLMFRNNNIYTKVPFLLTLLCSKMCFKSKDSNVQEDVIYSKTGT